MKSKLFIITTCILLFFSNHTCLAQTVAIVGYNGSTGDGYTIVALDNIAANTKIYFTDSEYISGSNAFSAGEGVWSYTTPSPGGLSKGDVVTFTETATSSNVLALSCNTGTCGSFNNDSGNSISLASTTAEGVYAYSDTDADHTNGITEIYAVIYSRGALPGSENPTADYNNAFVVDGFPTTGDHRDFQDAPRALTVSRTDIEDPSNYDTGNGNQALSTVAFAAITLPVELLSFDVKANESDVTLEWITTSELNNDYFDIERSASGLDFTSIGRIKGNGNTVESSFYSFEDKSPSFGLNYYRLKQVDWDGKFEYSDIVSIRFNSVDWQTVELFPNPSQSGIVNLDYHADKEGSMEIAVFDVSGKLAWRKKYLISEGKNNLKFNLAHLGKGIYMVKLANQSNPIFRKLIIR